MVNDAKIFTPQPIDDVLDDVSLCGYVTLWRQVVGLAVLVAHHTIHFSLVGLLDDKLFDCQLVQIGLILYILENALVGCDPTNSVTNRRHDAF